MKNNITWLLLLMMIIFVGCSQNELGQAPVPDNYEQTITEWQEYRIGVLTDSTGWLRIKDLIWLEEGENSFGSGDQDIQFHEESIPDYAGIFTLNNGNVMMNVADGIKITYQGEQISEMEIFDGENRPRVEHESLIWFVDSRGDDHGIRIYDRNTPNADAFTGFPAYELDSDWHLQARFIPYADGKMIPIMNVLGDEVDRESPGKVEFSIDGEIYSVDAFEARSGLFLMIWDETAETETYQAGRYMIIPFPDENGNSIIDFNKAYNPPCAFSVFTTCQLPPPQNRLSVAIEAGEKRPVGWVGR